jgi:hypothetical protein
MRKYGITKTTIAAALTFTYGLLNYLGADPFLAQYSDQIIMAAGVVFGVLRFLTTTPVFGMESQGGKK